MFTLFQIDEYLSILTIILLLVIEIWSFATLNEILPHHSLTIKNERVNFDLFSGSLSLYFF